MTNPVLISFLSSSECIFNLGKMKITNLTCKNGFNLRPGFTATYIPCNWANSFYVLLSNLDPSRSLLANKIVLLEIQIHSYYTRNCKTFQLLYCRTNTKQFSAFFTKVISFTILLIPMLFLPTLLPTYTTSFKKRLQVIYL